MEDRKYSYYRRSVENLMQEALVLIEKNYREALLMERKDLNKRESKDQ